MQRLEVSGAVRPIYGSLGVKGLSMICIFRIEVWSCLTENTDCLQNKCHAVNIYREITYLFWCRVQLVSLEYFIDIILPTALWPWG